MASKEIGNLWPLVMVPFSFTAYNPNIDNINEKFILKISYWADDNYSQWYEDTLELNATDTFEYQLPIGTRYWAEMHSPGYQSISIKAEKDEVKAEGYSVNIQTKFLPEITFDDALDILRSYYDNRDDTNLPDYGVDLHPGVLHNFPGVGVTFHMCLYEAKYKFEHKGNYR